MDFSAVMPVTARDARTNGRVKLTPSGEVLECVWASRPIFARYPLEAREGARPRKDWDAAREVWETEEATAAAGDRWARQEGEARKRAANRARKRLYDLAMCNDFDLFITLTLDPREIDRYDYNAVVKKLNVWLDNKVRRHGLRYVLVPELHKDGAIHFHGFINSKAVRLVDSGRVCKGQKVYNLPDWKLGFTTAIYLYGDRQNAAKYICKYVVKQLESGQKVGGRYYYHGGQLEEPRTVLFDWDAQPEGNEYDVPDAGLTLVYVTEMTNRQREGKELYSENGLHPGGNTPKNHVGADTCKLHGLSSDDRDRHENFGLPGNEKGRPFYAGERGRAADLLLHGEKDWEAPGRSSDQGDLPQASLATDNRPT